MSRRILIVDDNADQGRPLALILKMCGYEAEFVDSGPAALTAAHNQIPGLMIVDLMMPEMNGLDVLRHLRNDPRTAGVPVVIYSASSDETQMAQARRAGASDYWVKVAMRIDEICHRVSAYFPGPPC